MEELLINKIMNVMLKNETPSGVIIMSCWLIMLYKMRFIKKDVKDLKEDISFIKVSLINRVMRNDNVIELGNKKPNDKRD